MQRGGRTVPTALHGALQSLTLCQALVDVRAPALLTASKDRAHLQEETRPREVKQPGTPGWEQQDWDCLLGHRPAPVPPSQASWTGPHNRPGPAEAPDLRQALTSQASEAPWPEAALLLETPQKVYWLPKPQGGPQRKKRGAGKSRYRCRRA